EEKPEEIQVPEHQRAGFPHPVANLSEMDRQVRPVKTGTVVVAEMESFVHEVHFVHYGYGICEIIFGTFRIAKSVLDPCRDCVDKIHAEDGNEHVESPNAP